MNATKYEELCEHASNMEQLAATAERASIKYKQVEFMADRIGQEFDGTVSGVTEFGLYVEVDESKCEGGLGDKVRIRVERANLERRQLDFALVSDEAEVSAKHIAPPKAAKPVVEKGKKKGRNKGRGKAKRYK